MNDLRLIFRYGKPYRRDLWAAAGLIFIECIFEMVIPVLMSTLVDEGVPSHNMAIILRQGGLMTPPCCSTPSTQACAPLCAARSCWPWVWAWHFCSAPS